MPELRKGWENFASVSYERTKTVLHSSLKMAGLELKVWEVICYCIIFAMGLIGNVTICLVVLKSGPSFRLVPFNVYLMALAMTDLTIAVVCLPIYVMSTSTFPHPDGTRGIAFCKILTGYFIPFWLGGVSIYLLVVISFERLTAVRKPLVARTRSASRKTYAYIVFAWLIGLVIQLATLVGVTYSKSDPTIGNYCSYISESPAVRTSIYACTFTLQYVVPAVIFIINFYRIQKCLTKLDDNLKRSFGDGRQQLKVMEKKKKTVRIVFVVSVAFFVCWTPNNVMYFLFQYGGMDIAWDSDLYQAGIVLGFFNSCINPFLYAFQSQDFRSHCRKIFKKMFGIKGKNRQPGQSTSKTTSSIGSASTTSDKARLVGFSL